MGRSDSANGSLTQHALGLTDVEFLTGEEVRQRFPYAQAEEITAGTFRQRDGLDFRP